MRCGGRQNETSGKKLIKTMDFFKHKYSSAGTEILTKDSSHCSDLNYRDDFVHLINP